MGDRGHNKHGPNTGGGLRPPPFFGEGEAGSPSNTKSPGPRLYLHTKWHVSPSSRLAKIEMGRQLGTVPPFEGWRAGSLCNTMSLGPRPTSIPNGILIHPAIWPQKIWAENWGGCALWGGELDSHLMQCGQGRGLPACSSSY